MYGNIKHQKYNNNQIEMNIYYRKLYEKVFPYFLTQNFFDYFYYHAYGMGKHNHRDTRIYTNKHTYTHNPYRSNVIIVEIFRI